jgi:transketolase
MLTDEKRKLELMAATIRKTALETIHTAGSGHIGGSFSMADIMAVLYFKAMNVDPKNPAKPDRDRLVVSKGHCSPVTYATLALKGFFPLEHLKTFRKIDSDLSGHVEIHVPGVDMSGGSLGQGLSVALGMAMYAKANNIAVICPIVSLGDNDFPSARLFVINVFSVRPHNLLYSM